jgi:hypothetical protein
LVLGAAIVRIRNFTRRRKHEEGLI